MDPELEFEEAFAAGTGEAPPVKSQDLAGEEPAGEQETETPAGGGTETPAGGGTETPAGGGTETPAGGQVEEQSANQGGPSLADLTRQVAELTARNQAYHDALVKIMTQRQGPAEPDGRGSQAKPGESGPDEMAAWSRTLPEEVQQLFQEEPIIRDAVFHSVRSIVQDALGQIGPQIDGLRQRQAQLDYEQAVLNGWQDESGRRIEGHPDFRDVVRTSEFRNWAASNYPNLNPTRITAADTVGILGRYKQEVAARAAAAHDAAAGADLRAITESAVEPGTRTGSRRAGPKEVSEDEAFELGIQSG